MTERAITRPDVQPTSGASGYGVIQRLIGRDGGLAYLLLAPTLAILIGLIAYPLITAVLLSLQDRPLAAEGTFIGLQNFATLLNNPTFQRAALNSAVYTSAAVMGKFLVGLTAALILHQAIRFRALFRALLVLPWSTPVVVGAFVWRFILDDSRGVLNYTLFSLGVIERPILWLVDPKLALWSVILVVIWQGTPFYMLNFLAGLTAIDHDLYEAAAIDGAGPIQKFRYITLPGLRSVIAITLLISTIWTSASLNFVFILTQGGPLNATQIFPMLAYTEVILNGRLGLGAAIAVFSFPVFAPLIFVLTRLLLKDERS